MEGTFFMKSAAYVHCNTTIQYPFSLGGNLEDLSGVSTNLHISPKGLDNKEDLSGVSTNLHISPKGLDNKEDLSGVSTNLHISSKGLAWLDNEEVWFPTDHNEKFSPPVHNF